MADFGIGKVLVTATWLTGVLFTRVGVTARSRARPRPRRRSRSASSIGIAVPSVRRSAASFHHGHDKITEQGTTSCGSPLAESLLSFASVRRFWCQRLPARRTGASTHATSGSAASGPPATLRSTWSTTRGRFERSCCRSACSRYSRTFQRSTRPATTSISYALSNTPPAPSTTSSGATMGTLRPRSSPT